MTEVSLYFGWTVRYFPVCDCRHLHCYTCLMTIESSSSHGLQRTCICTVYKQINRQLQADMDSLCQFLFRENALCRSRSFTFCIKQQERERKWAKNRDTGETCAKDPAVSLRIQNVHYPTTSVKDMHTSRGWTGQLLALGDLWRMRQTQHYGILRTKKGKSLRTRSDVPLKYAPVTKRLIMALWNVKEHVS